MVLVSVRRVPCPVHTRGLKEAVLLHQGGDLRRISAGPPCHQINVLAQAYMAVGADQPDGELRGRHVAEQAGAGDGSVPDSLFDATAYSLRNAQIVGLYD